MRQGRHAKHRRRKSYGSQGIILPAIMVCVIGVLLIYVVSKSLFSFPSSEKQITVSPTPVTESSPTPGSGTLIAADPSTAPEPGTLLESGSDLNDNFFAGCDYQGYATDLTESTFMMGKAGMPMAFDGNGHYLVSPVTFHYGEDTVMKKATLYYESDTYEMYASSLNEFVNLMNASSDGAQVVIYLKNPDSEELWVKEIRIFSMILSNSASPSPTAPTGTLLESGSNPNDNLYGAYDYNGGLFDLTGSTFTMMPGAAWDGNGHNLVSPVTFHYGEDTIVKRAVLNYGSDTYKVYASSLEELNACPNATIGVVYLENPDSEELWVKEICICTFEDL